jgi:hypothetical protein
MFTLRPKTAVLGAKKHSIITMRIIGFSCALGRRYFPPAEEAKKQITEHVLSLNC